MINAGGRKQPPPAEGSPSDKATAAAPSISAPPQQGWGSFSWGGEAVGRLRLPQELGEQQGHSRDAAAPADVSPGEMQGMLQLPQCQISAAGPSPLPPARSPGVENAATELLSAVFGGKGSLKGKAFGEKGETEGSTPPFLFMPLQLHAAQQRRSIPRRANYHQESSRNEGWAILHLIY